MVTGAVSRYPVVFRYFLALVYLQIVCVDYWELEKNKKAVIVDKETPTAKLLVSCGRVSDNQYMTVKIVDKETLQEVPEGHVGEIWASGYELVVRNK